ncbi:hypothetical protein Hypma_011244 [Hypsizygus marmoreus]|uniref:Uncharacterized protein n=1 Tax=Hypsizygus marmoreus TaxID=39966 RepID=A0A369JM06_HYPMA|nr:hypothetical protein Hypma_011244 [Hypsizygus marmoreus]
MSFHHKSYSPNNCFPRAPNGLRDPDFTCSGFLPRGQTWSSMKLTVPTPSLSVSPSPSIEIPLHNGTSKAPTHLLKMQPSQLEPDVHGPSTDNTPAPSTLSYELSQIGPPAALVLPEPWDDDDFPNTMSGYSDLFRHFPDFEKWCKLNPSQDERAMEALSGYQTPPLWGTPSRGFETSLTPHPPLEASAPSQRLYTGTSDFDDESSASYSRLQDYRPQHNALCLWQSSQHLPYTLRSLPSQSCPRSNSIMRRRRVQKLADNLRKEIMVIDGVRAHMHARRQRLIKIIRDINS